MRKMLSVPIGATVPMKFEAIILGGWLGAFTKINLSVQSMNKAISSSNKQLMEAGFQ